MANWNGRTVLTQPDQVEQRPEGGAAAQFVTATRRHHQVAKMEAARRRGIGGLAEAFDPEHGPLATQELLSLFRQGRVTRQQIEGEQRADEDRIAGFMAAPPQPGTEGAERIKAIRYRMAVRRAALDVIDSTELALLTSTTGRSDRTVTDSPPADRPWRQGAAQDDGRY